MKSILLYANDDAGFASRLEAALDLSRALSGHLTCVQATPFQAFILGDPFGGIYAMPEMLAQVRSTEAAHRARVEENLAQEGVSWDWIGFDGSPAQVLVERSSLADLIVLSLPAHGREGDAQALSLTAEVALHVRAPVLAVPREGRPPDLLGTAVVAWNGSPESAHALRLSLSMLSRARGVHIVAIEDDGVDLPAEDACRYLARHGIGAELHQRRRGDHSVAEAILNAAAGLGGSYLVIGAYGHSRFREAVLGGVTRDLIETSHIPLLLAH